jgi:alpha-tubulin suppressor-like RCC1 family protein
MKKATTLIIAFTLCIHFGYSQCWKTVSVGVNHTLAIKKNGTLWAWGINQYGQLGDGGTANLFIPTQIGLDSNWSSIAAGENHSIALKSDGSLWAWGHNLSGQLGDSTYIDKLMPIRIGLSNNWQFISAGTNHNMAIQKDSTLWGWGQNGGGKIGTGSFASDYFQPYLVDNSKNWKTVSAGQEHSLAVRYNGTLWGCGSNIYGALGLGSAHTEFQAIQQIGASTDWSQVSASILFSLAIKNDSTLWGWGRNFEGQLGNGTTTSKLTPVQVDFQSKWLKIATGYQHSVAIKSDSSLWAWGNELGNGVGISTSPISKSSNHTWTTISAKGKFSMSIQQSNSLFAWGTSDNGIGQFGLGSGFLQSFSPMQVSRSVASCNPTTGTFSQSACGSYVFNGQTLTTSGVYKDTLQNAAGCDSVITLNLTINQATSSTLNQSACGSYTFNNQTLTQSGTYKDTLQNVAGCDSIVTLNLTINATPSPTVTASGYNLTTQSYAGYQWQLNGSNIAGATAQNHTATANGSYSVAVTDANGCQGTSTAVNIAGVGIHNQSPALQYSIYPNPVADLLHIRIDNNFTTQAEVYAYNGQLILTLQFVSSTVINTKQWPYGIYFIQLKDHEGHKINHRIVKE